MEETMIISRSNKRATIYNNGIRNRILYRERRAIVRRSFNGSEEQLLLDSELQGDGFIANGEIIQVMRVRRVTEMYGFRFADITARFQDYDLEIDLKILLDTLQTDSPALPKELNDKLFYTILEDYEDIPSKAGKMKR